VVPPVMVTVVIPLAVLVLTVGGAV